MDNDGIAQLDRYERYLIFEINLIKFNCNDRQECVAQHMYYRRKVDVISLTDKSVISCYVYIKCNQNEEPNRPSPAYKNVIINGAIETGIPQFYIDFLKSFDDNQTNEKAEVNIDPKLFKVCL